MVFVWAAIADGVCAAAMSCLVQALRRRAAGFVTIFLERGEVNGSSLAMAGSWRPSSPGFLRAPDLAAVGDGIEWVVVVLSIQLRR